jgi:hypothetical protein
VRINRINQLVLPDIFVEIYAGSGKFLSLQICGGHMIFEIVCRFGVTARKFAIAPVWSQNKITPAASNKFISGELRKKRRQE